MSDYTYRVAPIGVVEMNAAAFRLLGISSGDAVTLEWKPRHYAIGPPIGRMRRTLKWSHASQRASMLLNAALSRWMRWSRPERNPVAFYRVERSR